VLKKVETLIVGGGAMGLSVAYNLMKRGREAYVLEGDYFNAGATGRNVGVLKTRNSHAMGDGNEDLVALAKEGLKLHSNLSSETGINTFYKKSGCLIVAKDEEDMRQLNEYHEYFIKLGLSDIELSPEDIHSKWPYIDPNSIIAGFYAPDEANAHPFGVVWAYIESIKSMKGTVEKQNKVITLEKTSSGYKVYAKKGEYEADNLVVACAADTSALVKQLGYELPLIPDRKEVLISEPVRPMFGPTVERLSSHFQVTQTMRGEIMGTIDWMDPGFDVVETTSEFMNRFADEIVPMMPVLRDLNIIRQWTGICDRTPDYKPAVGELGEDLYVNCGYYDYGMTMVPIVGRLLAETIIKRTTSSMLNPFDPRRFG
jgi:sarcosine oxidase subunit beta